MKYADEKTTDPEVSSSELRIVPDSVLPEVIDDGGS